MLIKKIKIDDLRIDQRLVLSYPSRPGLYSRLQQQFPLFPLVVVNRENALVFGVDFYEDLRNLGGRQEIAVMQGDFTYREALFLAYNLKDRWIGFNLYEKLLFIQKIFARPTPPAPTGEDLALLKAEIYARTPLDVNINAELLAKLETLFDPGMRDMLAQEKIALKTALQLCDVTQPDRHDLLSLFDQVSFSASHQLQIIEMVEDILFRDKCTVAQLFEALKIAPYLAEEKPQKKIIDAIFIYRYPLYTEKEKQWQEMVKDLQLPPHVRVTHFPFFEKKQVEVRVTLREVDILQKNKELLRSFFEIEKDSAAD